MELFSVAGVRNLTQIEAAERARLLDVTSYDITIDLTDGTGGPGERTFRSTTVITFGCTEPGASTFIEAAMDRIRSATLNGSPIDVGGWSRREGPDPHRSRRAEHPRDRRRRALLHHRPGPAPLGRPGGQGGLPLQPVRDRGRAARVRELRPARPEERLHLARHRAGALVGHLELAGRVDRARRVHDQQDLAFRTVGPDVARTSPRSVPGRTTRCASSTTGSTSVSSAGSR